MQIDDFIQAEFQKLVPYKPLTAPELAAIKLSYARWLEAKLESAYDNWSIFPHERTVVKDLIRELSSFNVKEGTQK